MKQSNKWIAAASPRNDFISKINELFRNDYLSMNLHDHDLIYKAKNEGIAEGKIQGIEETKIANAKNAIKKGFDLKDISEITGLSLEQVQKLADEMRVCENYSVNTVDCDKKD